MSTAPQTTACLRLVNILLTYLDINWTKRY